jgi:post-segregation antitoxin (ccd killing protein)
MPRMQVYLPEELHRQVKERQLPVSELLQRALQAELRRLDLLAETDRYVAALTEDVGAPTPADRKRAEAVARRIARRPVRKAG